MIFWGFRQGRPSQPARQPAGRPANQPASQPVERFAMRGVHQKAPGDLPGQPWGTWWPGGAICGHFWSPFWTPCGTLWVTVVTPGAPLASPWAPFAFLLRLFLQPVLHGFYFGCQGGRAGGPRGCKCGFCKVNTDVLRRCAFGAQGAKKASPGWPGTYFWHLFGTFWITLASLSPPVATLRPHFRAPAAPLRFNAFLYGFWCPRGLPKKSRRWGRSVTGSVVKAHFGT